MKKVLLLLLTITVANVYSQEFKVGFSNEFEIKDLGLMQNVKIGDSYFREEVTTGGPKFFLTVKLSKMKYGITLYRYDANMKETQKLELDNGKKEFGPLVSRMIGFDDKLLLFYYRYTPEETIKLFVSQIEPSTLAITDTKEIFTYNQQNVGLFKLEDALQNRLSFALNPDKSKILITSTGVANEVFTCILDKKLNISRKTNSRLPGYDKLVFTSVYLDNDDNKYLSYEYANGNRKTRAALIQNNLGKEKHCKLELADRNFSANSIVFKNSADHSKVYAYSTYNGMSQSEGICITTVDPMNLNIGKPILYPYPDEILKKSYKFEGSDRARDKYSMKAIDYSLNELQDGTLALTGFASFKTVNEVYKFTGGLDYERSYRTLYACPIITLFISPTQTGTFSIIPREQIVVESYSMGATISELSESFGVITIPYKNSIICIYDDKESNLNEPDPDKVKVIKGTHELELASVTINSNGNITSRKIIAENAKGKMIFFTQYAQQMSPSQFVIPIGREKTTFMRFVKEITQWATVDLLQ